METVQSTSIVLTKLLYSIILLRSQIKKMSEDQKHNHLEINFIVELCIHVTQYYATIWHHNLILGYSRLKKGKGKPIKSGGRVEASRCYVHQRFPRNPSRIEGIRGRDVPPKWN